MEKLKASLWVFFERAYWWSWSIWLAVAIPFAEAKQWVPTVLCLVVAFFEYGSREVSRRIDRIQAERRAILGESSAIIDSRRKNLDSLSDSLAEWDRQLTERERSLDAASGRGLHVN